MARAFLTVSIVLGCAFLWIGLPVLGLWVAGQLIDDAEGCLFAALGGIPLAMVICAWSLSWLNAAYLELGGSRSLIEIAMTASAVTALVVLLVWFFLFAETTLVSPL